MSPAQQPPQRIEALSTGSSKPATIIFLHGYGDDADGLMSSFTSYFSHFRTSDSVEGQLIARRCRTTVPIRKQTSPSELDLPERTI